ncbi:hypothetical protein NLG97_g8653 [Lecanicillium saksenae]|uniref:Uncharacterized protein n=1 Tax=Lecanicillium saksenae TaxID=468837 RepID=A0ACC1QJP6_9HYPO|nr:hypothetical protein NLG97_g8653 [Lecanicillium saksenae]
MTPGLTTADKASLLMSRSDDGKETPSTLEVQFKRPMVLPSRLGLEVADVRGGFALRVVKNEKEHLTAKWTKLVVEENILSNSIRNHYSDVFNFAIPRQRFCMAKSGYLDESLFNDQFDELVDFLLVPAPTETILRNINSRPSGCPLIPYDHWDFNHMLLTERNVEVARMNATSNTSSISNLPTEILLLVFDNISDMSDVMTFGLTCQRIWSFARIRLCDWQRQMVGPWAGKKLVAVGNSCDTGDYPPGLFTNEEIGKLNRERLEEVDFLYGGSSFWRYEMSFFALEEVVEDILMPEPNPRAELKHLIGGLIGDGRMDAALYAVSHEMTLNRDVYGPDTEMWMLRNLTTREFVRSEAVAIKPEFICGPYLAIRGFQHLLLARTCWADSWVGRTMRTLELPVSPRGDWAGHMFEICTVKHHEKHLETTGEHWSDVSCEIAVELDTLWEARYGKQWRKVFCHPAFKPAKTKLGRRRRFS